MTEPETGSEIYSDIDKSAVDSENSSHYKSVSDYNTDASSSISMLTVSVQLVSNEFKIN